MEPVQEPERGEQTQPSAQPFQSPKVPGMPAERVLEGDNGKVLVLPWTTDRAAALQISQLKHQLDLLNMELSARTARTSTKESHAAFHNRNIEAQKRTIAGNERDIKTSEQDAAKAAWLIDAWVPINVTYYPKMLPLIGDATRYMFPKDYASVHDAVHAKQVELIKENALRLKLVAGSEPVYQAALEMGAKAEDLLKRADEVEDPREKLSLHNRALIAFAFAVNELAKVREIDVTKEQKDWAEAHKQAHQKLEDALHSLNQAETTLRTGVKVVIIAGAIYATAQTAGGAAPLLVGSLEGLVCVETLAVCEGLAVGTTLGAAAEFGEYGSLKVQGLPITRDPLKETGVHAKDALLYSVGSVGALRYAKSLETALKYRTLVSGVAASEPGLAPAAAAGVEGWFVAGTQAAITELPAATFDTSYDYLNGDIPPDFMPVLSRFSSRVALASLSGSVGFQGASYREAGKTCLTWLPRFAISVPAEASAEVAAAYLGIAFEEVALGRPLSAQEREDLIVSSIVGWGVGNVSSHFQQELPKAAQAKLDEVAQSRNDILAAHGERLGLNTSVTYVGVLSPHRKVTVAQPEAQMAVVAGRSPNGSEAHFIVEHLGSKLDGLPDRLAATDHDVLSQLGSVIDTLNGGLLADSLLPYHQELDGVFLTAELDPVSIVDQGVSSFIDRPSAKKHLSTELDRVAASISRLGSADDPQYPHKLNDRIRTFNADADQRLSGASYRTKEPAARIESDQGPVALSLFDQTLKPLHDYLYNDAPWIVQGPYALASDILYFPLQWTGSAWQIASPYVTHAWDSWKAMPTLGFPARFAESSVDAFGNLITGGASLWGNARDATLENYRAWREMPVLGAPLRLAEFSLETSVHAVGGVFGVAVSIPYGVPYVSYKTPIEALLPFGATGETIARRTLGRIYDGLFPGNAQQFAEKMGMYHEGKYLYEEGSKKLFERERELEAIRLAAESGTDPGAKVRANQLETEIDAFRKELQELGKKLAACKEWITAANSYTAGALIPAGRWNEVESIFQRAVEHSSKYDERIMLRALHDTMLALITEPRIGLKALQAHLLLAFERLTPEAQAHVRQAILKAGREERGLLGGDRNDWRVRALDEKLDFVENVKLERETPSERARLRDPRLTLAEVYKRWAREELQARLSTAVANAGAAYEIIPGEKFGRDLALLDRTQDSYTRDRICKALEAQILSERRVRDLEQAPPADGKIAEIEAACLRARDPKAQGEVARLKALLEIGVGQKKSEAFKRLMQGDYSDVQAVLAKLISPDSQERLQARNQLKKFLSETGGPHDAPQQRAKKDEFSPYLKRTDAVYEIEARLIDILEKSSVDELQSRLEDVLNAGNVFGGERKRELTAMLQRKNHEITSRERGENIQQADESEVRLKDAADRRSQLEAYRRTILLLGRNGSNLDVAPWSLNSPLILQPDKVALEISALKLPPAAIYRAKASSAKIEIMRTALPFLYGK